MTSSKKILSLVMTVVMILGCVTVAFAAPTDAASVTVTSSAAKLAAGETATITVAATTNFKSATISIPVFYDKTLVDVSNIVANDASLGSVCNVETDATSENAAKVFANTGLDSAKYGFVFVNYICAQGETLVAPLSSKTLFTFVVTAKADVTGDATIVAPAGARKTTSNQNGTLYFGSATGTELVSKAENVENVDVSGATTTISVGAVVTPTLMVKEGYADVKIDKYADEFFGFSSGITGVVYGIETIGYSNGFSDFKALADVLTTSVGDANLRITASNVDEGYESTGSLIEVLDNDGVTVLETYYFVYFGDINGDGYIDNIDATAIETYALTNTIDSVYEMLAGDVNADTYTDNVDATEVGTAALNDSGYPVQENIANTYWDTILPEYQA